MCGQPAEGLSWLAHMMRRMTDAYHKRWSQAKHAKACSAHCKHTVTTVRVRAARPHLLCQAVGQVELASPQEGALRPIGTRQPSVPVTYPTPVQPDACHQLHSTAFVCSQGLQAVILKSGLALLQGCSL